MPREVITPKNVSSSLFDVHYVSMLNFVGFHLSPNEPFADHCSSLGSLFQADGTWETAVKRRAMKNFLFTPAVVTNHTLA